MRDRGGRAWRRAAGRRQGGGGHELGKGAAVEHGGHPNARIAGLVGTIVKHHLKYALELLFVPLARGDRLHRRRRCCTISAWPWRRWRSGRRSPRLEAWLRRLPPWAALLAFVAPSVARASGQAFRGLVRACITATGFPLASVVVGKMLATALVARLYRVLRPTLVTMPGSCGPRPGCSTGATGSTPSCAPCRPGRRPTAIVRRGRGSGWRNWFPALSPR